MIKIEMEFTDNQVQALLQYAVINIIEEALEKAIDDDIAKMHKDQDE